MTLGLLYLPAVLAIVWILLADHRDRRRDRQQFFLPPSRELRVQTLADAFQEDDPLVTWEHAYALAVLAVDVLELEETTR